MQNMVGHYIWRDSNWEFSKTKQRSKFYDQVYFVYWVFSIMVNQHLNILCETAVYKGNPKTYKRMTENSRYFISSKRW